MENLKTAKIINGKEIAAQVRAELKSEIEELKNKTGTTPGSQSCSSARTRPLSYTSGTR